jgi:hypothetical protein
MRPPSTTGILRSGASTTQRHGTKRELLRFGPRLQHESRLPEPNQPKQNRPDAQCELSGMVSTLRKSRPSRTRWGERIMRLESPTAGLCSAAENSLLPPAYKDLLLVLLCEGLRRHGCWELASELKATCSDPVYRKLLDRWFARVQPHARRQECMS